MNLIHTETAQECNFDSNEAAENFLANVADPEKWDLAANVVIKADNLDDAGKAIDQLTGDQTGNINAADLPDAGADIAANSESQA